MNKQNLLRQQIQEIQNILESYGADEKYNFTELLIKKFELEEKIIVIDTIEPLKKNKTLQDAYDNFNNLYKIETGKNYNV